MTEAVGPAVVRDDGAVASGVTNPADGPVALVHDQLVQRGGAERVTLLLTEAFPDAPLYTSFYEPADTFPEFASVDVRPSPINRIAPLRARVRLALPVLAPAFSRIRPDAAVTVCSSTGWAHGVRPRRGRTVVYCHAPARWLYQPDPYHGRHVTATGRPSLSARAAGAALTVLGPSLRRWDRRAAARAQRYLANSSATAAAITAAYGIEAEVLPPPPGLDPDGPWRKPPALADLEPGFWLCVARLLPYKNVDVVMDAVASRPGDRLVVVGEGPELTALQSRAGRAVRFTGAVDDDELRWLYGSSRGLLAASFEDFGLTPLEAAAFGKPSVVLGAGGFLDTVEDGVTGVFFDDPDPASLVAAMERLEAATITARALAEQTRRFGPARFVDRLREIVAEELAAGGGRDGAPAMGGRGRRGVLPGAVGGGTPAPPTAGGRVGAHPSGPPHPLRGAGPGRAPHPPPPPMVGAAPDAAAIPVGRDRRPAPQMGAPAPGFLRRPLPRPSGPAPPAGSRPTTRCCG